MLAIAVEREGPFKALLPGQRQPGTERGALAAVPRMPHHLCACRLGCHRGRIRRTVVHDHHGRHMRERRSDQGRNRRPLVETRDDQCTSRWFNHASILTRGQMEIERITALCRKQLRKGLICWLHALSCPGIGDEDSLRPATTYKS